MKRFYIPFLLMAAAAVAACENKAVVEEPAQGSYVFTLRATSPDLDTKTDYSSTGKFSWSEGDAISVLFHNEAGDNKFFTLTATTINGASADFSGAIDEGYEIGASDGTDSDKNIWALYPASDNHSFTVGNYPKVFIPSEIDFTASGAHYSANMPMYAQVTSEENVFAFKHLAAAFKFTFTGVSAERVKFVIENLTTYQLSDLIPIALNGAELFMDSGYADVGSKKGSLTMTANVVDGDVSFYVPVRYWGDYQPKISLYDASDDGLIYTNTAAASKHLTTLGEIKPITISVSGFEYQFTSKYGINWNDIAISGEGDTSSANSGIKLFKAFADATYFYVYFVVDKNKLIVDPSIDYANRATLYLGDENDLNCKKKSWIWGDSDESIETYTASGSLGWLVYLGTPAFYSWEAFVGNEQGNKAGKSEEYKNYYYYEIRIRRDNSLAPLISTSKSIAHAGIIISYQKYNGGGSSDPYMIAPKKAEHGGALLRVPLPAYVAPTN